MVLITTTSENDLFMISVTFPSFQLVRHFQVLIHGILKLKISKTYYFFVHKEKALEILFYLTMEAREQL